MADHYWPGQERNRQAYMHVGNPKKGLPWATIVGVVANTAQDRLCRYPPDEDQWYVPTEQPAVLSGTDSSASLVNPAGGFIVVRSSLPADLIIGTVRETVAGIDPLLPLEQVKSMSEVQSDVEAPRRFNTDLISWFLRLERWVPRDYRNLCGGRIFQSRSARRRLQSCAWLSARSAAT